MTRRRRLLVQGLGAHALKTVLPAIGATSGWDLAGIVSRRVDVAAEVAAEWGVVPYESLGAALSAGTADGLYVATEPSDHVQSCREAFEGGVDTVFCEKPLATQASEVAELVDLVNAHNGVLCEAMAYQYHPQFGAIRRALDSDAVGGLAHGYARFSYPHLADDNHRYDPSSGGGALLDAGLYPLSLGVSLMGDVPLEVVAGGTYADRNVDIAGHATLSDDTGRTFQCSWQIGSAYSNLARLVGAAGSVEIDRPFSKPPHFDEPVVVVSGWGSRTTIEYEPFDQFAAMLDDVARHRNDIAYVDRLHSGILRRWTVIEQVMSAISRQRPRT